MSKYKERALQILNEVYDKGYRSNYKTNYHEQCCIEAMCQLAEEVEKEFINKVTSEGKDLVIKYGYTKEQVEELLQKQRELSSKNAKLILFTPFSQETDGDSVRSFHVHDNLTIDIDEYSILNAKLKID
ncbi:MAG: hypothetical protein M0R17_04820 [Candidatus Omnitrophica bacterium]|jgi:hypothetical protein|nr:hypothetical protein [Candidatus Omnitrophota bacterium]